MFSIARNLAGVYTFLSLSCFLYLFTVGVEGNRYT
jgi:hypothetical protein